MIPSKRIERCVRCDEPTGRAGKCEDSLYLPDGEGPFCETHFREVGGFDESDAINNHAVKAAEGVKNG